MWSGWLQAGLLLADLLQEPKVDVPMIRVLVVEALGK